MDCNATQVDEEAAIRANTTILLGNLASHLSEPACKRVLLNAFTRALKDGFPPARIAGLKVITDFGPTAEWAVHTEFYIVPLPIGLFMQSLLACWQHHQLA